MSDKLNEQLSGGAYRQSGKAHLQEAIDRLRQKADQYEALLKQLPDELTREADEGLWLLSLSIQR